MNFISALANLALPSALAHCVGVNSAAVKAGIVSARTVASGSMGWSPVRKVFGKGARRSREAADQAAALLSGAVAASEASSSAISVRFSSSSVSCGKASPRRALKPGSQPETSATVRRSSASSTSKRPSAEFETGDKAERGDVLFVSDCVG